MLLKNDTQLVIRAEEINTARKWVNVLGKVWRRDDICRMNRSFWGEEWAGGHFSFFFFLAKETIIGKFHQQITVIIAHIFFGTKNASGIVLNIFTYFML